MVAIPSRPHLLRTLLTLIHTLTNSLTFCLIFQQLYFNWFSPPPLLSSPPSFLLYPYQCRVSVKGSSTSNRHQCQTEQQELYTAVAGFRNHWVVPSCVAYLQESRLVKMTELRMERTGSTPRILERGKSRHSGHFVTQGRSTIRGHTTSEKLVIF